MANHFLAASDCLAKTRSLALAKAPSVSGVGVRLMRINLKALITLLSVFPSGGEHFIGFYPKHA